MLRHIGSLNSTLCSSILSIDRIAKKAGVIEEGRSLKTPEDIKKVLRLFSSLSYPSFSIFNDESIRILNEAISEGDWVSDNSLIGALEILIPHSKILRPQYNLYPYYLSTKYHVGLVDLARCDLGHARRGSEGVSIAVKVLKDNLGVAFLYDYKASAAVFSIGDDKVTSLKSGRDLCLGLLSSIGCEDDRALKEARAIILGVDSLEYSRSSQSLMGTLYSIGLSTSNMEYFVAFRSPLRWLVDPATSSHLCLSCG